VAAGSPLAAAAAASSDNSPLSSNSQAVSNVDGTTNSSMQHEPLLKLCAKPLQPWLVAADQGRQQQQQQQQHEDAASAGLCQQPGAGELQQRCRSLLDAAAATAPKQQLTALTPTALSAFLGGQQVSCCAASTSTPHLLLYMHLNKPFSLLPFCTDLPC